MYSSSHFNVFILTQVVIFLSSLYYLSSVEIPKFVQDGLKIPIWREVVLEGMRALEKNDTWQLMIQPQGKTL